MSCRVFKRELEYAVFDRLVQICKDRGLKKLAGYYYRTPKNGYVSDLLADLGFNAVSGDTWEFALTDDYQRKNRYIEIEVADSISARTDMVLEVDIDSYTY
jgi:predicted enzyme involved in methoxymalonyl-ACP biosynthesis